ncbi:MAG: hypothetical protein QOG79_6966 [Mycobacterium sp.]|nr:hypothetical protein [Mycobacterium sp.]MDT5303632.1 hypothetical protein [Mycobacterium sp.]
MKLQSSRSTADQSNQVISSFVVEKPGKPLAMTNPWTWPSATFFAQITVRVPRGIARCSCCAERFGDVDRVLADTVRSASRG